jgi:hypothetical protein
MKRAVAIAAFTVLAFLSSVTPGRAQAGYFQTSNGDYWHAVNGGGVGAPPYWGLGASALSTN